VALSAPGLALSVVAVALSAPGLALSVVAVALSATPAACVGIDRGRLWP
jgi:hypothetical protein